MNDKFNEQKEKLVSLSHEINLLRQQVNFLLRNEKALELLDLDVLMNRTHTIYDMLCAINLGDSGEDEDLAIDPETLAGLFGAMAQDEDQTVVQPEQEETTESESESVQTMPVSSESVEPEVIEPDPLVLDAVEPEPIQAEPVQAEPIEPEPVQPEPVQPESIEPKPEEHVEKQEEQVVSEETATDDDLGFVFRFENVAPIEEETPEEQPVMVDDKLVHFVNEVPENEIPERDRIDGEHLVQDNPFEMPKMENEDADFEMTTQETLGDRMLKEDHSLAAKLQQNPVNDLKSAIGINDKFLFVNELFGGSMEKYNKSIENLNDLKTQNGALIYLNELKIELQWNSSNEAYKKLTDLVKRKFE